MKKKKLSGIVPYAACLIVGAVCGIAIASQLLSHPNVTFEVVLEELFLLFLGLYLSIFLQTILHETGHLLFGLLTGYRFRSFRIGSLMLMRTKDGKLRFKRFRLAGTGGQCLMTPPERPDGTFPYILYNLGGSLFNILTAAVFTGLYHKFRDQSILSLAFLLPAIIGIAVGLLNGIPMRLGAVDNDGYNILSLHRSAAARRSFYIQLAVNGRMAMGEPLTRMPAEWFTPPTDEEMQNSVTAVLGVFCCNRLMAEERFAESDRLMQTYLATDTAIVGIHRQLLICDRIYCELMGENRAYEMAMLYDRDQRKFMHSMAKFPSILRTEYAVALLADENETKAAAIMEKFQSVKKAYPYASDIETEERFMAMAREKYLAECK